MDNRGEQWLRWGTGPERQEESPLCLGSTRAYYKGEVNRTIARGD